MEDLGETTSGAADIEFNKTSAFTSSEPREGDTDVFYAYLVIGLVMISAALSLFMIFIATPPRNITKTIEEKKTEEETEEGTRPDDVTFKAPFLVGVFIFFVSYCMVEGNYGNFLLAYAVEGLGWSKSMGATVTSVFWTSFTIGRGLGIILVKYISPQVLLGTDCLLSVVSMLPMLLWAHSHVSVLWISSVALGLTMSTIFATGITWTERYVKISGAVGTIFLIAGATGEIVGPLILSAMYKRFGIEAFVYIMFTATAITLVFYALLQAVAYKRGERYIEKEEKNNRVESNDEEEREIELEMAEMLKRHEERDAAENTVSA